MNNKYLPVGSIVLLDGGTKRLMVTGYCMETEENPGVIYDYSGALYPEGLVNSKVMAVFNHDQIKRVDFVGFKDDEGVDFLESLKEETTLEEPHKFINIEETEIEHL